MKPTTTQDLLAVGDIAAMVGLKTDTVHKWRQRYSDFPTPFAETSGGAVWRREEILAWLRQRRRWPVYHRIQLVNKSGSADNWSADILVDGHFRARVAVWRQDKNRHVRVREGDETILEQVSRQALSLDAIYDLLEGIYNAE